MAVPLSQKTVETLAGLGHDVRTPAYDRRRLRPGVLHIGLGNFHRSHMATYLDRLFARGEDQDWAVIGAGVMPADARMRRRLHAQDWLSTVVDLDPEGCSARVVGAMVDFVPVVPAAIVRALADPDVRIVSMTITEGGYFLDAGTGRLDARHPRIRADAADPRRPGTIFGMLVKALAERRAKGHPPFTVLSCDNLPGNGEVTRSAVVGMAELVDRDLADWIRREVTFPNSMVDCITPSTTARERELVSRRFGIEDAAPVVCEPFRQWVIEDRFCAGRPALERVGVEFVDEVSDHETMKLRILNAGHASIAYVAALLGYRQVHTAMGDLDIREWLSALQEREILPALRSIEGKDYHAYRARVVERFRNAEVADTVSRLCANGSTRQPKFILPAIRDALGLGLPVAGLALELALWCHYCRVADDTPGMPPVSDPLSSRLRTGAVEAAKQPRAFLGIREIFHDLAEAPKLCDAFARWLALIDSHGPRAAIRHYIDAGGHHSSSFHTSYAGSS
ncbi:mannitol dehydrogenase family protein [Halomonas urumqiensis]|uniref:Mannitol dehydrogenase n=1 Tax=Halomonas urumqiensis TaxID=1684789 RepID=A0A2N7UDE2_9GAMM|nr:mannitol dehydrogenase family protein [Halomonas urumqiensis]PMR78478.1 mannitol dehydrogenase [Halomonas urumqiensis]PTB03623.1 mannitol dehydrogenase family protein [Halomonas urumqiensis]GHE20166.1 mannitol 2-dehydrogenase [Halomonas urumqiensis]